MAEFELAGDIVAARQKLVSRFEQFSQEIDNGCAWGFSLDHLNNRGQVGIYGTVAAVEVLTMAKRDSDSPLIAGGVISLCEYFPDENRRWYLKHDLDTTLKRACMARLSQLGNCTHEHRKWLVDNQGKNLGWGAYIGTDHRSESPDFVSSCYALIGLADHFSYHGTPQATAAIQWILDQVADLDRCHVCDLALALIAVTAFAQSDEYVKDKITLYVKRSSIKLQKFMKQKHQKNPQDFRDYFHFIGTPPDARREPFQIPVELTVLRALLSTNVAANIRACRSSIHRLTNKIIEDGGVDVKGLFRTETQYWAALVLFELNDSSISILSKRWLPWRDQSFIVCAVALVAVIFLVGLNTLLDENSVGSTGLKAIAQDILKVAVDPLKVIMGLLMVSLLTLWKVRK